MVRLSDIEYDWVDQSSQDTNTDLGGGWYDDGLGHYWNPASQGWQDTQGQSWADDPSGSQGWEGQDYSSPQSYQGPVDFSNPDPGAWSAQPNWWEQPQEDTYPQQSQDPWIQNGGNGAQYPVAQNWWEESGGMSPAPRENQGFWGQLQESVGEAASSFFGGGDFKESWQDTVPNWLPHDEEIADVGAAMFNPSTVVTAFAGPAVGAGIRGATASSPLWANLAGRAAANLIEPAAGAGPWKNLLIEGAMNAGGQFFGENSGEFAAEHTDNPWLIGGAEVGGALVGALTTGQVAKGGVRGLGIEDVSKNRYGPLAKGDSIVDPAGKEWTVLKPTEGTARSMVKVVDEDGVESTLRRTMVAPASSPEIEDLPRRALLDALNTEATIRRVGQADREIHEGRLLQVANYSSRLAEGRAEGLTGQELADFAKEGLRVGQLRKTVADPIELPPAARDGLFNQILDDPTLGEFQKTNLAGALDKMLQGYGVQPKELRNLQKYFGDDVANLISERPKMSPLQLAREQAREIKLANELEARQTRKMDRALEREMQQANRKAASAQETLDRQAYREKWKALAKGNGITEEHLQQLRGVFTTIEERDIGLKAFAQQEAAAYKVSADGLREKAAELTLKLAPSEDVAREIRRATDLWVDNAEVFQKSIGESKHHVIDQISASLRGDVSDSYVSSLLTRRGFMENALKSEGYSADAARRIAKLHADADLKTRYPNGPPPHVLKALEEATVDRSNPAFRILDGLATLAQVLKNSTFGLGDLAVFGVQGLKTGLVAREALIAGVVNRVLNIRHLGLDVNEGTVAKRIRYEMDGVSQHHSGGLTDLTNDGPGTNSTLLGLIPGPTRMLDNKVIVPITKAFTDLQFKTIMGNLKNLVYEGNLVMAHVIGQDINNPRVRFDAAEAANSATSTSRGALRPMRNATERATLLSPSMRRAQVNQILQIAAIVGKSSSPTERLLGTMTIISSAISLLAISKLVNDYVGVGEFEWNPSKHGFGDVKLANGTVINLFPQEQVVKAIAVSFRELANHDPEAAAKAWARLGISSSSPVLTIGERSVGVGYQPGRGYRFGDLDAGMSPGRRVLNAAPIPPLFADLISGRGSVDTSPWEVIGINAYKESPLDEIKRKWNIDPFKASPGFYERNPEAAALLNKWKQQDSAEARGRLDPDDLRKVGYSKLNEVDVKRQKEYDQLGRDWQNSPQSPQDARDFRDRYGELGAQGARDREILDKSFGLYKETGKLTGDPKKDALNQWYAVYDSKDAQDKFGKINHDVVAQLQSEAWAGFTPGQKRAILDSEGRRNQNSVVAQFQEERDQINKSGYWQADGLEGRPSKTEFRQNNEEIAALVRKWGFSEKSVLAEDVNAKYAAQQKVSDAQLNSLTGESITPQQWRDQRHDRLLSKRGELEGIYAGLPDLDRGTPTDNYFKEIDGNTDKAGKVDWDRVDAWLAKQPATDQATIDRVLDMNKTPMERQYRSDTAQISDSGYWDIRDAYWTYFAEKNGIDSKQWTEDKYWDYVRQAYQQQVIDAGYSHDTAAQWANIQWEKDHDKYYKPVSDYQAKWREENPAIGNLLAKWQYAGYGEKETLKRFSVLNGR